MTNITHKLSVVVYKIIIIFRQFSVSPPGKTQSKRITFFKNSSGAVDGSFVHPHKVSFWDVQKYCATHLRKRALFKLMESRAQQGPQIV